MTTVTAKDALEVGPRRILTKGRPYAVIGRKQHPSVSDGYVVIKADDGRLHTLSETLFK